MASKDITLIPLSCCKKELKVSSLYHELLSTSEIESLQQKYREYEAKDFMYCQNSSCSAFIDLSFIKNTKLTCTKCRTLNCGICKSPYHPTLTCISNKAAKMKEKTKFLELIEENKWQVCGKCENGVSISTGCNHMRCRCGHEFCYVCGKKWKDCGCP